MTKTLPIPPTLTAEPSGDGLGGLLALVEGSERALPLQSVRVRTEIAGFVAHTVVEQTFRNDAEAALEVLHLFPVPNGAAVVAFELRAGEVRVVGECQVKEQAEATFEQARQEGHRAGLLSSERDDVHSVRLTNLPPKSEVHVRVELAQALEPIDGKLTWRFPTTIPPRYLPGTPIGHSGQGVLPDTDQAPDASRLQPPLRLEGGTALDLEVTLRGPIAELASSLHAVKMALGAEGVRVAPSTQATLNKDFILSFSTGEPEQVGLRAWTDGRFTAAVVAPPTLAFPEPLPRDATFIVDISGSMSGVKMEAAKQALFTAVHGLMPQDRFRLIAFDDRLEVFKGGAMLPNTAASLAEADRWIAALQPRGGTEMLPAIQKGLEHTPPEGRLGTVLFVTDGQAWNETQLMAAVAHRRKQNRFFTLGIDTAVNESLLDKLARVGGGHCTLATPREDIEAIVAGIELRFGSPLLSELSASQLAAPGARVVYSGRPALLLMEGAPRTLTVTARGPQGPVTLSAQPLRIEQDLGPVWARRRIESLEDRLALKPHEEEALLPEIERVALAHGIASRRTSFVAVDKSVKVDTDGRESVVMPHELPESWDEAFRDEAMVGAPPPAPMLRSPAPMSQAAPGGGGGPVPAKPKRTRARGKAKKRGLFGSMFERKAKAEAPPMVDYEDAEEMDAPMLVAEPDLYTARAPTSKQAVTDPAAALAQSQQADGGFGNVQASVAALAVLVLSGHTRRAGLRRRTVLKLAQWLAAQPDALAKQALSWLAAAEAGQVDKAAAKAWVDDSAPGRMLKALV